MTLIHYRKPDAYRSNGHTGLRTFDEIVEELFNRDAYCSDNSFIPAANIYESKEDYRIELAVPGLKRNQIKVTLDDNVLKIHASTPPEEKKEESFSNFEFDYSNFERSFSIPDTIEREKISAKYHDGILQVILPKRADQIRKGPKDIDIK